MPSRPPPPPLPAGALISDQELLHSLVVLYVEDDPLIRGQLALFLKRRVGALLTADNGEQGLAIYRNVRPDIVITDILMPGLDGLEMAKAIRDIDPDSVIIVTTAYNDEAFFMRSIELGIDRYVLKPSDPHLLSHALLKCARIQWQLREREAANRYINFILDIHPNFLLVVNDMEVEYLNRGFLHFLGFESQQDFQKSGMSVGDLIYTPEGIPLSTAGGGDWVRSLLGYPEEANIFYLHKPGQPDFTGRPYNVVYRTLPDQGRHVFSFSDITRLENQIRELEKKAYTDPLTGACNRAQLQNVLHAEMQRSQRHGSPLSLILFDLDHFKRVNDTYGHQVGDDVLQLTSELALAHLRASDLLARWGGEEFMIVLPETDHQAAANTGEKLRVLLESTPFPLAGRITASFGLTQFQSNDTIRTLTERADRALYQAKSRGRNRLEFC